MANLIKQYAVKNPTYTSPKILKPVGFVLHSVGTPQPDASVFAKNWNKSTASNSVHAVCDPDNIYILLPCLETKGMVYKCWGVGKGSKGSYNDLNNGTGYIQIEMAEPSSIKYVGGATFTCSDPESAREYVYKTMDSAAQFIAECCVFHGIDPSTIQTHASAHKLGYGSNHGDPNHLWDQLSMNYTLEDFRNLVRKKIQDIKDEQEWKNMTDEKFAEYADRYFANKAKEPASAWSTDYLSWVKTNEIMIGDETGNQAPQAYTKREELSTMLKSFYTKFIAPLEEKLK